MITTWDIYWITRLDSILMIVAFIGIGSFTVGVFGCLFAWLEGDVKYKDDPKDREGLNWKIGMKALTISAVIFLISVIIGSLLPSTKSACAIYMIPKIMNNEKIQELPTNAIELLNTQMKAWIEDIKKDK